MVREQVAMGLGVAALSLMGLVHAKWLIARTRKGQRLVNWFGPERGLLGLRIALLLTTVFGAALAAGWINPVCWTDEAVLSVDADSTRR